MKPRAVVMIFSFNFLSKPFNCVMLFIFVEKNCKCLFPQIGGIIFRRFVYVFTNGNLYRAMMY